MVFLFSAFLSLLWIILVLYIYIEWDIKKNAEKILANKKLKPLISILGQHLFLFITVRTSACSGHRNNATSIPSMVQVNMLKGLKHSSMVLTTHRMDEAESLCDNIAIMINGRFVCYGSPGHLKTTYGKGYTVMLKYYALEEQKLG